MAILVEHEKRRHEILERALDIFIEEGYEDATFQKIADRCGITRTTLYLYFKNKREIFVWSIKQLTNRVEKDLISTITNESLSYTSRLESVLHVIIDLCTENRRLFNVVLTYLLQVQKTGKDPDSRVKRRTIRLRHLLSRILIAGKDSGEFKIDNVKAANELFYGLIESAIFRIAILDRKDNEEIKESVTLAVRSIST
ncbi:MAG TPA: TetR/AcrR family transcriptional regulator [Treponemataceae bacterium]|jgi:AcrR family transcriptional regulator|nr:TetR/AcrR family transcriptional regulator [Treponemataceae bacterium]HOS35831.1 TetR/AcrR family transcriptional regulator [Treponemataceae bacterium]HOU38419.1 TetR/AcrR family transcriptional regulator [Treponemataceae bacterium]HPL91292.1 TetR/AcrR family transcriptional regulator [Treponemataceae bacterium]HQF73254.1 TetR/AcrR family transcriptional regulator [Treponemataceae bacterium]